MAEAGHCTFCGAEIDPDQDYRKVTGWEKRRSAGGTNALAVREPHDEWACRWCIGRMSKGLSAQQGSLV